MNKRLELVWPNKDKVLLGLDEHGKPVWGTKADLEPRLLVQLEAVGQTNRDNLDDLYEQGDNLLIKGDNLLALKALERHFAGKIKCIYIDPPFNTGNAFEYYDDGLEHTIWLSMMKARLEILKTLLSREGVIFVHIDFNEIGALQVLLNEIFGRRNFVSLITWQRTPEITFLGQGQSPIITITEYLLIYAKEFESCLLNRVSKKLLATSRVMQQYNLIVDLGEKKFVKDIVDENAGLVKVYCYPNANIQRVPSSMSKREYLSNFDKIFRYARVNPDNSFLFRMMNEFEPNTVYSIVYKPRVGKNAGNEIEAIFHRRNQLWPVSANAFVEENEIYRSADMSNLWTNDEISATRIANEGGVEFRRGKKPEALVQRVLDIASSPGDWVLDSFLGSGTTAAVAHKLGRKWIGIELGEHAETLCLPRLKRVVSGEDQTGISKQVGWKGGGGFRYCVLGESLFAKDRDTGLVMINPQYTNGLLVAAVCNLEDFRLNNDSVFHGVRGNIYAHITEEKVTQAYLDSLVERLPDGKSLTIYCLKRATGLKIPPEVKIKRIPKELRIPRYLTNSGKGGTE